MDQTLRQAIRASVILTSSYVAGTLITDDQRKYNNLIILADFTKGSLTSASIKIETADKIYHDLAYDGQSDNFTVGSIVTGASSGAKGTIISDTDAGDTGTLIIDRINNINFLDNEAITDDNGTPGAAVVNGTMSVSSYTFYLVTGQAQDPTNSLVIETSDPLKMTATGKYRFKVSGIDRYIRISAIGEGTATSSLLAVDAILQS